MGDRVLVIGGGGREHALGWKLAQSPQVQDLYFAPGNGGTSLLGTNVDIAVTDTTGLLNFATDQKIDFTVVGPEAALEAGVVDAFRARDLNIFGPTKAAAQIETSKAFTASFMERYNIPQPTSVTVNTIKTALQYTASHNSTEYVIKADGLAAGKGVILPASKKEAEEVIRQMLSGKLFGEAGQTIVFQERLIGQEVSAFAVTDGQNIAMLPFFQDHKPVYDGDKGPNTGGIGCYTPVPIITDKIAEQITTIMQSVINGLRQDGILYTGVLYAGLFVTPEGPKVIEFNARFGDPECEPMMLILDGDFYPILKRAVAGDILPTDIKVKKGAIADVVLCSAGYPTKFKIGYPITGLESINDSDILVFHAGTKTINNQIVTTGGRVLNVTAYGNDLKTALDKAYSAVRRIHFKDMHYRTDIGQKALNQ
jgi:phosphoribosylamine--glycine ligase